LTASAALTPEAKAATTAVKSEYFIVKSYRVEDKEWIANTVCWKERQAMKERMSE
jgi:hypothetical protein